MNLEIDAAERRPFLSSHYLVARGALGGIHSAAERIVNGALFTKPTTRSENR